MVFSSAQWPVIWEDLRNWISWRIQNQIRNSFRLLIRGEGGFNSLFKPEVKILRYCPLNNIYMFSAIKVLEISIFFVYWSTVNHNINAYGHILTDIKWNTLKNRKNNLYAINFICSFVKPTLVYESRGKFPKFCLGGGCFFICRNKSYFDYLKNEIKINLSTIYIFNIIQSVNYYFWLLDSFSLGFYLSLKGYIRI